MQGSQLAEAGTRGKELWCNGGTLLAGADTSRVDQQWLARTTSVQAFRCCGRLREISATRPSSISSYLTLVSGSSVHPSLTRATPLVRVTP